MKVRAGARVSGSSGGPTLHYLRAPLVQARAAHGLLVAALLLAVAAEQVDDQPPPADTGRAFSLVSLPSLLPSLLPGPSFNLFNINKPPINIGGGGESPPASGGLFGLPPSVWVVNSAGTASSGGSTASAGTASAGSR